MQVVFTVISIKVGPMPLSTWSQQISRWVQHFS